MSRVIAVPRKWIYYLKTQEETGPGYQDGTCFDQVVAGEGSIIQVRGYNQVPLTPDEVMSVEVNHRLVESPGIGTGQSATGNPGVWSARAGLIAHH